MGANKVQYGSQVLLDISDATVTPDTLLTGESAYNAAGEKIAGSLDPMLKSEYGGSGPGIVAMADKASEANSAESANTAVNAQHAATADTATNASNASQLGGKTLAQIAPKYSTAETQMPYTWVDGKAIYRKTIALSPLPNNGEKEFLAATGVNKAWFVEPCWMYQTTGEILNLISGYRYQGVDTATVDFFIRMKGSSAYIVLKSHRDRSSDTAYATIEYTKA